MRPLAALLMAALAGAECERAAPESFTQAGNGASPSAASAGASPAQTAMPSAAGAPSARSASNAPLDAPGPATGYAAVDAARCILATPVEPPVAVSPGPAPGCPADPENGGHPLPVVRVAFPDAGGIAVDAELVHTEHDSMRGLMYRKSLGAERGMLFDLMIRDDHKFWMHNTCIPLDLLYVDEDGLLVGIVENAPTLNDESRGVGCLSRWVLEVNAGWARRHGVKAGQHVKLP